MIQTLRQHKSLQFLLLVIIFMLLYHLIPHKNDMWPVQVWDPDIEEFEDKPLMRQATRFISDKVLFLIELVRELILGGQKTIVYFTSWDFVTENEWAVWPVFAGLACVYIAVFGQWEPSMQTLSFVLIAAPVAVMIGLFLGIWGYKYKIVETILNPLLNVAQIMPHFSYLIPVMVFYGIGDHAGAIATIIFATPPMVRLTILGLKKVPPEVTEAGLMSGCSSWQLLRRVLIPTARRDILIGVNQVIMQCLAMVVIASLIGAKGLGNDLLIALNRLRIGLALEIGVCIVLIAIVLDRLSLAH